MTSGFIGRGGVWVAAQTVLLVTLALAGPGTGSVSWASAAVSVPFLVFGAWLGVAGYRCLGSARVAYPEPVLGAPLVTSGLYARVRHPLYAALLWLGVGWSVLWASATAGAATLLLFVLLVAKARSEERRLMRLHPSYVDYRRRVPAFFPFLR